jgi:diguanylate cyclase (GGDEF)-like protein
MKDHSCSLRPANTPEENDKMQVISLNHLAYILRFEQPRQALWLAQTAEAISRRHNDELNLRHSLIIIGVCQNQLREDLEAANHALLEAVLLCEQANDQRLLAEALTERGDTLGLLHEGEESIEFLIRALALHRHFNVKEWQVRTLRILGGVYVDLGRYGEALHTLLAALQLAEDLGFEWLDTFFSTTGMVERSMLFNLIGIVYSNMNEFAKAIEYYQETLHSAREKKPALAAKALYNIGIAYEELQNYPAALEAYKKGIAAETEAGTSRHDFVLLSGIGRMYLVMGQYEAAKTALSQVIEGLEGNPAHISFYADALHALGRVHFAQEAYGDALACFHRVEALHKATNRALGQFSWVHQDLYQVYKAIGDYEKALYHHECYHQMISTHQEQAAAEKIRSLMVQFDTEYALKQRELYYQHSMELERQIAERKDAEAKLAKAKEELERKNDELDRLSRLDPLTGLANRRHLDQVLAESLDEARQVGSLLSVMICDIDNFKEINDWFSHATGDEVLKIVAHLLQQHLQPQDTVARYGGEEFVVVFPGKGLQAAIVQAGYLLTAVRNYAWSALHPTLHVTLSAGVAQYTDQADHEKLLHRADRELYRAKWNGKNRLYPLQPSPAVNQ